MKSYDELAERVFRKADERTMKKKIRMMRLKRFSITVSGMCAVILVMFGIWKNESAKNALSDNFNNKNLITDESVHQVTTTAAPDFTSLQEITTVTGTVSSASSTTKPQTTSDVSASVSTSSALTVLQTASVTSASISSTSLHMTTTVRYGSAVVETSAAAQSTSTSFVSSTTATEHSQTQTTTSVSAATSKTLKTSSITTTTVLTTSRVSTSSTTYIWTTVSGSLTTTTMRPSEQPVVTDDDGNIPVYIEYPTLLRAEPSLRPWYVIEPTTEYVGISGDLSPERIGGYIETVEISDRSLNGSVPAEIYSINKMSTLVCVALKIEGRNGYSLYRNPYYTPATLGEMITDMNLLEEAEITAAEWLNIDEGWRRDIHIDKETVFEKLFTDYSVSNGTDQEYKNPDLVIYIDIPFLNKKGDAFFITPDGCVQVTIIDYNAFFDIGKDNVDSLINYITENNLYT